jgi:hypothetical protein
MLDEPYTVFYGLELLLNPLIFKWQNGSGRLSFCIVFSNNIKMFLAFLISQSIPNSLLLQQRTLLISFPLYFTFPFHNDNGAQLGCMKLIYIHQLAPLLQLVFHLLDRSSLMSTPISKTGNNLLVIYLWLFSVILWSIFSKVFSL